MRSSTRRRLEALERRAAAGNPEAEARERLRQLGRGLAVAANALDGGKEPDGWPDREFVAAARTAPSESLLGAVHRALAGWPS